MMPLLPTLAAAIAYFATFAMTPPLMPITGAI